MTRIARRRLRRFAQTLLTLLAVFGLVAVATPKAQEGETAANPLIESLSNLDAVKLDQLYKHIGIEPSGDYLDCLCPTDGGFHYRGTEGLPCWRTGPLGGVERTSFDMARAQSCGLAFPLADGRTVLDAIAAAARRPGVEAAARVCRTFVTDWSDRRAALSTRIRNGRDALAAWMERKLKSDDVYRGKSWLWAALWATFNWPVPQRDEGFKYDPGSLGANLNQDMGAFKCLNELFSRCEAAIGDSQGETAPSDAKAQSAMGTFAQQLAAEFEDRAQQAFDASIELKNALGGNRLEIRISAEVNREVGYADMCRAAAEDLVRIGSGAPNPYSDQDADENTTAAPSFPRG